MAMWDRPGYRPVAWWVCENSNRELERFEREYDCFASALIGEGFADAEERRRIEAEGVIAEQLEIIAKDRAEFPDEYEGKQFCI